MCFSSWCSTLCARMTFLFASIEMFSSLYTWHTSPADSELVKMVKPDIHTLAHHLKQERLYVASEKQLIQRLNNDVLKTAEKLYQAAWIAKQQRINLDRLILTRSDLWSSIALTFKKIISLHTSVYSHFVAAPQKQGISKVLFFFFLFFSKIRL